MTTARDWLVGKGLAKQGRGKFSNDAKAALAKAVGEGVKFSDWPKGSPVVTKPTMTKNSDKPKAATEKHSDANAQYYFPDEYRFPEAEYRGVTFHDGKRREVSLRECCNTCRVSLVNHACEAPTIHGNITVKIERR